MEQLIVRLGSQLSDPVQWLSWSSSEQEIIASGELASANDLTQLQERALSSQPIIGIVPSCDLVLKEVALPPKASRKVVAAIPFMVEDEVCGDVHNDFFALGDRSGDTQQVVIVNRNKLALWQQAFSNAQLECNKLVPDILALPYKKDAVSIVSIANSIIVRTGQWQGFEGEAIWVETLLQQYIKQHEGNIEIQAFSDVSLNSLSQHSVIYSHDQLPLQLLLSSIKSNSFNLLQGEFAVRKQSNQQWKQWRLAAALAGLALFTSLISKTVHLYHLESENTQLASHIKQTVDRGFPNIGPYRNVKGKVSSELRKLQSNGSGISMLVMINQLTDAFANTEVKPQSLRFDMKRTELRMQSVANNFESLERFRKAIEATGLDVEQGAINNQGSQVIGSIIVKG